MTIHADIGLADTVVRLGVASLFGAVVGFERELDGHDAGIRTHLLLAMGAAMFGLISVGGFDHFLAGRNDTNLTLDPSRIASYVVAGIGFLGGGAILKRQDRIYGLTTAASLWTVAAIGLAAGLGFWAPTIVGSLLAVTALLADRPLQRLVRRWARQVDDDRRTDRR